MPLLFTPADLDAAGPPASRLRPRRRRQPAQGAAGRQPLRRPAGTCRRARGSERPSPPRSAPTGRSPASAAGPSGTSAGRPARRAREVQAPAGIEWVAPEEMTVRCGAGTPVAELDAALAEHGPVRRPAGLAGRRRSAASLAVGRSGMRRLGHGPVRDTLLQAGVVTGRRRGGEGRRPDGEERERLRPVPPARRLARARSAFVGDVILRTRPRPARCRGGSPAAADPRSTVRGHRPVPPDVDPVGRHDHLGAASRAIRPTSPPRPRARRPRRGRGGPPRCPRRAGCRCRRASCVGCHRTAAFVAEVGVGVVHTRPRRLPPRALDAGRRRRCTGGSRRCFDPTGRLNPGRGWATA